MDQVDPDEPIYSVSGSDEFSAEDPKVVSVIDALTDQDNGRCWYAITEKGIDESDQDAIRYRANKKRNWSGKVEIFQTDDIQSHLAVCGPHCFIEAQHEPCAPAEHRRSTMISNDPEFRRAMINTINGIARHESTRWQCELSRMGSIIN